MMEQRQGYDAEHESVQVPEEGFAAAGASVHCALTDYFAAEEQLMSAITKRTPYPPFATVDETDGGVSQLFRRMFNEPVGSLGRSMLWSPTVEVAESTDAITLTAELPGMTEDQITLTIENNVLSITGEKRAEREVEQDEGRYLLSERFYGTFQRSFTLPSTVDVDAIKAAVEKGVLTVRLPKTPQAKGRVIKVSAKK